MEKEHGSEVKGMTSVGWARARQLANQSEIPLSTVKRMAAFNRHRKNAVVAPEFKSTPWKDRGYVAWLGWGGDSGISWAVRTSAANDSESGVEMNEDAYRSSPKVREQRLLLNLLRESKVPRRIKKVLLLQLRVESKLLKEY